MGRQKINAVGQACAAIGTQRELSLRLGVTEQAVCNWVKQGWVPLRRAQEIEALTGVPRQGLINPRIRDLVTEFAGI